MVSLLLKAIITDARRYVLPGCSYHSRPACHVSACLREQRGLSGNLSWYVGHV